MPILGTFASSVQKITGSFESIASTTVGSGGVATISFTSIPQTYKHLQVRGIAKTARITGYRGDTIQAQFNGDTGSNYYSFITDNDYPFFAGPGNMGGFARVDSNDTANYFAGFVVDILDYTNTNKNKTTRCEAGGFDAGGGAYTRLDTVWNSTAAITSFVLTPQVANIQQYSSFSLYGIKE